MPLLARVKTRLGRQLSSHATVSEGAQTMLCAYLSIALLVGLGANAVLGWWWADPVTALVIAAVAVREGVMGWRGGSAACCSPILVDAAPPTSDHCGCCGDEPEIANA